MEEHTSVGERIAYYRRRRGLTQGVLSGRVGRSVPWLSLIERGERTVEKIADLLALANVLKVEPGDLIGGISLPPNGGAPLDPPRGIPAIRRALFARPVCELPDLASLRATAEEASRLRTNGRYEAAAIVLPELLVVSRAAAAQEMPGSSALLARVCQVTLDLVREVGERDLALLVADRYVAAAERSGDELLVAAAARHLSFALLGVGMLDAAGAVCSNAADVIVPTNATSVEGWSMWGSLRLTEAIVSARATDPAAARRQLGDARAAAEVVGPGRDDYSQAFGPANVGLHEVDVALESGDPVEALRIADTVDVDALPKNSRRAAFCLDAAHAHGLRRDDGAAVAVLLEAERYAPDRVRYSVKARELVRVCLERERRSRTPGLRGLAERLGVAA